jgi:hypothetical protein
MYIWDGRRSPTLQITGLDGSMDRLNGFDRTMNGVISWDDHTNCAQSPCGLYGGYNCKVIGTTQSTTLRPQKCHSQMLICSSFYMENHI